MKAELDYYTSCLMTNKMEIPGKDRIPAWPFIRKDYSETWSVPQNTSGPLAGTRLQIEPFLSVRVPFAEPSWIKKNRQVIKPVDLAHNPTIQTQPELCISQIQRLSEATWVLLWPWLASE